MDAELTEKPEFINAAVQFHIPVHVVHSTKLDIEIYLIGWL